MCGGAFCYLSTAYSRIISDPFIPGNHVAGRPVANQQLCTLTDFRASEVRRLPLHLELPPRCSRSLDVQRFRSVIGRRLSSLLLADERDICQGLRTRISDDDDVRRKLQLEDRSTFFLPKSYRTEKVLY